MSNIVPFLTTLASAAAIVGSVLAIYEFLTASHRKQTQQTVSYDEKIKSLTESLRKASSDTTQILEEIATILQERQKAVTLLEQKQSELQRFVTSLEQGPGETLKIYQEFMDEQTRKQDKENRKMARKYFIYGALVSLFGTGVGLLITFLHR